jgi:cell division cycle protein 37
MSRPFDYSKWDRLEISDDEQDAHPNIDSSLMIRIKREQRARREAEEEMKKAQLRKIGTPEALKQVEEIEKRSRLHVDNICRVVDEKTIVNKPTQHAATPTTASSSSTPSTPAVTTPVVTGKSEEEEFEDYVEKNEKVLAEFARQVKLEDSQQFLLDHLELLNEHACGWLLLHMLSLEMAGERPAMLSSTRQYLMLRNIMDLARETKRGNDARSMVQMFFKQIIGDKERSEMLDRETMNFGQQIINRAIQKKAEMAEELAQEDQEETAE